MGAIAYPGGVTFRTWAPGADKVQVAGDFNAWLPSDLGNDSNGNWSLDWPDAGPGQEYKLYLHNPTSNSWFWRADPRAQQMVNSASNCVIHDPSTYSWQHDLGFAFPQWSQQVIYEAHVGTFNSPGNGGLGTFQSAAAKLSYLQGLGVNVLELMPIMEFPGNDSWGYNPADTFAPASQYGTPDDLKALVDTAHSLGIAVVLDSVYNHFGPSDLSLWQFDGQSFGNGPENGGIYFYNDNRADTPWGDTRPDYGRQEVRDYINDSISQWVNEYHVDGIRLDATYAVRMDNSGNNLSDGWNVLRNISNTVHASQPFKLVIAEDMKNENAITQPTGSGGAGADMQWDSEFVNPIDAAITQSSDSYRDMNQVSYAVTHNYNGDPFQRVVYTESHDVAGNNQRLPSQIGGWNAGGYNAEKQSTLGAAIAFTSPGRPMIFEGQECLTPGQFNSHTPLDPSQCQTYAGISSLYQTLIQLRRNWNNNTAGLSGPHVSFFHVDNTNKVVAYHRWANGGPLDDVVVVANFSANTMNGYSVGLPRAGHWRVRFNSDWNGFSTLFGNTTTLDLDTQGGGMDGLGQFGTLNIGPYTAVILSQDN
jgi:1,4-alpha-glucan branching enzyme